MKHLYIKGFLYGLNKAFIQSKLTETALIEFFIHCSFKIKKMKNIILFVGILVLTSSCNQTGEKTSTNLN